VPHLSRVGILKGFDRLLRELGADPGALLRAQGVPAELFTDDDNRITTRKGVELLEAAARATGCNHFGLLLAERQDVTHLGLIGVFLQTSTTLASAIRDFIEHQRIHVQGVECGLREHPDHAAFTLGFDVTGLSDLAYRQFVDLGLYQAFGVMRFLTGGRFVPRAVEVHYAEPSDSAVYRRAYGAPVRFNCQGDCLVLTPADLALPMRKRDEAIHAALEKFIALLEVDADAELLTQVRKIIRKLLPTGHCSIDRVAGWFACDKRTLQRHLRVRGTSYQALLDEVRFTLALQYLEGSRLPMTQLSQMAGFSDASNFTRAFRRRFGVAPRTWRSRYGVPGGPAGRPGP